MKKVVLFFVGLLGTLLPNLAKASHVPGANITYTCVGPNQYQLTLTLFEDCGTTFQSSANLTVFASNDCGFTSGTGTDFSFSLTKYYLPARSISALSCSNWTVRV